MAFDVKKEWEAAIKDIKLQGDAFVGPLEQFSLAGGDTKIKLGEISSEPKGKFDLLNDGVVVKLGESNISLSGSGANGELVGTAPSAAAEATQETSKGAVR